VAHMAAIFQTLADQKLSDLIRGVGHPLAVLHDLLNSQELMIAKLLTTSSTGLDSVTSYRTISHLHDFLHAPHLLTVWQGAGAVPIDELVSAWGNWTARTART
jgi:hypothetical protein